MNAPTIPEYHIARSIFACNDHGHGGRHYWDHDDVTWRFVTRPNGRVGLELYALACQSGPGPVPGGTNPANLLGTWDLGPLSNVDRVFRGEIDAHGSPRPTPDDQDNTADIANQHTGTGPTVARPGYIIDDEIDAQRLTLRTLTYLESPVVCDALGHPGYAGYIASVQATADDLAAHHAAFAELTQAEQFAALLDDLCAPRT